MNLPISEPHGVTSSQDATRHHSWTSKHQYSNQSPRLSPPHHHPNHLLPSGGSFSTLTCSSLPLQWYNIKANPSFKPPSTPRSKPPSLVTSNIFSHLQCKLNVSRRTPDLPTPVTTDAPNMLPTPTTMAQPSHLPVPPNPLQRLAPTTSYMSTSSTSHPSQTEATQIPTLPHQPYSLTGDIWQTILHSKKNKGAGINSNSINLFITLVKSTIPSIKPDLKFIFNTIYQSNLPDVIMHYFIDVYLFCLHKDPNNHSKLCPLVIPTAIRRLIATHVARSLKSKLASHLLPYNYAVGIPNRTSFVIKAIQLAIKKFINAPQIAHQSPTRAAVFFNLPNHFNSVSCSEFFNIIAEHFFELLPLTTLFYSNANNVLHNWSDGTWRQLLMEEGVTQGCPLSPPFASFVMVRLLEPIDALLRAQAKE
jgi:hypothetical protein